MGKEEDRNFMRAQCRLHDRPNALPPQIFNDVKYCGDFNDFETATEDDNLMNFLKLENCESSAEITLSSSTENWSGGNSKGQTISNVETGESEAVEA